MVAAMRPHTKLEDATRDFYCRMLTRLNRSGIDFLVGGAYALHHYTGVERHTKDFDIFIRRRDLETIMQLLAEDGCHTELTFPHWLGKAHCGEDFIDVIFNSGNGIAEVDEEWFMHAIPGEVFGIRVRLSPPEEIIWSKAFIMERERYDGADIAHLIRECGQRIDWERLLRRFGPHWRVLLNHLVMFGFIYPCDSEQVPAWLMDELLSRLKREVDNPPATERICHGTLISRAQYLVDVERWGYKDARLARETMTPDQIAHWTAAIDDIHYGKRPP